MVLLPGPCRECDQPRRMVYFTGVLHGGYGFHFRFHQWAFCPVLHHGIDVVQKRLPALRLCVSWPDFRRRPYAPARCPPQDGRYRHYGKPRLRRDDVRGKLHPHRARDGYLRLHIYPRPELGKGREHRARVCRHRGVPAPRHQEAGPRLVRLSDVCPGEHVFYPAASCNRGPCGLRRLPILRTHYHLCTRRRAPSALHFSQTTGPGQWGSDTSSASPRCASRRS